MARAIELDIINEHPDYVELLDLIVLSGKTWPKFGLDIVTLSNLDDYTLALLKESV